jgi:hypothetical protein
MEYWLCRVLLHPGPLRRRLNVADLAPGAHEAVFTKIINGELGTLPDGCIVEPVSGFRTEEEAHGERARRVVDEPSQDWRVIVSMPVGR